MPATSREALLDAACDLAVTTGWADARMGAVAAAAGVSRQTLYNEFGSKDGLAQALALRETGRFLTGVEAAIDGHPGPPAAAVAAAVRYALTAPADNPLLVAVLTDDTSGLLPLLTTRSQPILDTVRDALATRLAEHWPARSDRELAVAAETATRLTLSYLVLPAATAVEDIAGHVAGLVDALLCTPSPRFAPSSPPPAADHRPSAHSRTPHLRSRR